MALIGYARVSTNEQHLHLQQDALKKAGCLKIYTDTISGAKSERKGLTEALEYIRAGDTLVVWRLDRLGAPSKTSSSGSPIYTVETSGLKASRKISTPPPVAGNSFSISSEHLLSLSGISLRSGQPPASPQRGPVVDKGGGHDHP
jgi:hypothetical protein